VNLVGGEPITTIKNIASPLLALFSLDYHDEAFPARKVVEVNLIAAAALAKAITEREKQMKAAAKRREFEETAHLRDRAKDLRARAMSRSLPWAPREGPPARMS
jgi:excinuclease UvrABC helicase subunit UvrB